MRTELRTRWRRPWVGANTRSGDGLALLPWRLDRSTMIEVRERFSPVLYRARLDLRARWRSLVLLSLLVGAVAGAVIACAAAARRTDSAFDRLRTATAAADLYVSASCPSARCTPGVGEEEARRVEELAGVRSAVPLRLYSGTFAMADGRLLEEGPDATNDVTLIASADPRFGTEVDELVLVSGRRVVPGAGFEVVVDKELSASGSIELGDRIFVTLSRADDDEGEAVAARPPDFTLEVVGIVLSPLGVRPPAAEFAVSAMFAGPALVHEFGDLADTGFAVSLESGSDVGVIDDTEFADRVVVDIDEKAASIDDGTEGDTLMLVVIFVLGGLGSLLVLSPVVSRVAINAQADADRLRTLGFTRRDLVVRAALHGAALGGSSAAVASVAAIALSPLAPIAEARRFEPHRGVDVDLIVVAGGVLIAAFVASLVTVSIWRSTRARRPVPQRPSGVARLLGSRRIGPVGSLGLRMGLGSEKAGSNVGYFVAIALGASGVTAALTFIGAVTRLQSTPRLVGMNFDLFTFPPDDTSDQETGAWATALVATLLQRPEIEAAGAGTFYPPASVTLGDDAAGTWVVTFRPGPRAVEPVVVSGRAPVAAHELIVHPDLLARLGEIGDTVVVSADIELGEGADAGTGLARVSREFTIVGTGVVTVLGQFKASTAMTHDGLLRLYGDEYADELSLHVVRVTFRDGVDHDAALSGLERAGLLDGQTIIATDGDAVEDGNRIMANPARDLVRLDLEGLDRVPTVLALLLGSLATCVLAIVITEKTRTWRSRLAIHRALGVTGWQLAAGVVTATVVMTLGAVLVALPLGVVAGRELWLRHAERLGVVPESPVPWVAAALVVAGSVVVAGLVALRPAWTSGRLRASALLRAE